MLDWSIYNKKQEKLSKKIQNHNKKFNFNYLHKDKYNHVRDHLAIVISMINKKKISILDYGGTPVSFFDLKKKNYSKVKYTIYNPHVTTKDSSKKNKQEFLNIKKLTKIKCDLLYINSVIQYIENLSEFFSKEIFDKIKFNYLMLSDVIVTKNKTFKFKQHNHEILCIAHNLNKIDFSLKQNKMNKIYQSAFSKKIVKKKNIYLINYIFKKDKISK